MSLSLVLSIISILVVVTNFILSILDRGKKTQKENNLDLIKYQLDEVKEDIKTIISKLDKYEQDIDERVEKAIQLHVQLYHKGG